MIGMSRAYTVRVSRDGKWWMVHVPDIDGLTQARRLGEVEEMARSLIAITQDVPEDSFELRVELEAIEDINVTREIERLHETREELNQRVEQLRGETAALARKLADLGVPVRDIGTAFGVSFQRAQQIVSEGRGRPESKAVEHVQMVVPVSQIGAGKTMGRARSTRPAAKATTGKKVPAKAAAKRDS